MGTTPNPLHGDAEDPNDRRQNNIQMPQRTEGGAAQQGQQQGQQQEETTTTVTAVRAEDNVEIKETGVTVHLVMSYANWVAYKVRCIQSTTLGSQIIESATSCGCCSLAKLNKLKRWEIFIRRRVMPSFYLINIGLIAYVWITWRGDSYWDDDHTSYFYSFSDDGCSPTPAPTDVRRYYGYQFANYYYYSNSGGSSSGCDDGADADDDGQANNAWFTKIYGVFLVVAFVAAALFLAIDFLFWVAIDVRLRAAFDLSLSFEVRDGVNLGSQNTFLTISRTQRIELAETDLSTYALGAALEDKSEVKIMLFKKDWKAKVRFVRPSVRPSVHPSMRLSFRRSVRPSVRPSISSVIST